MPVDTYRHTGPVDFAGNAATDLPDPLNAQDAATKAWTEALVAALAATCATDAELSAALAALAATLAPLAHTHSQADVTGLTAALAAKAAAVHSHAIADVTGLTAALAAKADTSHTHAQADVTGLVAALAAKAALAHTHAQADVTGLVAALAAKADATALSGHIGDTNNPHAVTAGQAGALPVAGGTVTGAVRLTPTPLTDAPTIAVVASQDNDFEVTLAGNRTLGNPTSPPGAGESQVMHLYVKQDATGGRTLAFDTAYAFSTDLPAPTLSVAPNAVDVLAFRYRHASGKWLLLGANKGFGNV